MNEMKKGNDEKVKKGRLTKINFKIKERHQDCLNTSPRILVYY